MHLPGGCRWHHMDYLWLACCDVLLGVMRDHELTHFLTNLLMIFINMQRTQSFPRNSLDHLRCIMRSIDFLGSEVGIRASHHLYILYLWLLLEGNWMWWEVDWGNG